jgi:hypothetical protein
MLLKGKMFVILFELSMKQLPCSLYEKTKLPIFMMFLYATFELWLLMSENGKGKQLAKLEKLK